MCWAPEHVGLLISLIVIGTSMNPLLRAAYLAGQRGKGFVTLMLPWLDEEKQGTLFGNKTFSTPSQQETYILNWLRDANLIHGANSLRIIWYPGRFVDKMGSIFPVEDVTSLIPDEEADVCILEEPEHLTWFRATGSNWSKKFSHVVSGTNHVRPVGMDYLVGVVAAVTEQC